MAKSWQQAFGEWRTEQQAVKARDAGERTEGREALVREAVAALTDVGFLKWRGEELQRALRLTEEHRADFALSDDFRAWFEGLAANGSEATIREIRDEYRQRAQALEGLYGYLDCYAELVGPGARSLERYFDALPLEAQERAEARERVPSALADFLPDKETLDNRIQTERDQREQERSKGQER